MKNYPKCFGEIDLTRTNCDENPNDFLLGYFIPKNKVTAIMSDTPAPEELVRTETALVMTALSTAKKILFISLTEDTDVVEKRFRTLVYSYMRESEKEEYQKKNIYVCGKDKNSVLFFTEESMSVNGDFFNYLFNFKFDLIVIDDIVEIMEEKEMSSRKLIKHFIEMTEQLKTTIVYTADTRYSDHAMLTLPCSIIEARRIFISDSIHREDTPVFIDVDYEIVVRSGKNDLLFDIEKQEYGNWFRLDELGTTLNESEDE